MTSFVGATLGARRGAHCASAPRSGLSRRIWWLRKAVCITSQPLRQATGLPPPLTQGRRGGFGGYIRRVRSGNSACLPPAGHFSPRKSAENAPGAAAPGPPWGRAACIPGRGIARAVTRHRAVPSHTACPFPASRGPVESDGCYGYRGFH